MVDNPEDHFPCRNSPDRPAVPISKRSIDLSASATRFTIFTHLQPWQKRKRSPARDEHTDAHRKYSRFLPRRILYGPRNMLPYNVS